MADLPWQAVDGGVELAIRLTPRASAFRVDGIGADPQGRPLLLLRLAAPPVDGVANAALIAELANALDLPKSAIALRAGAKARIKRLHITGNAARITEGLARFASAG